MKLQKSLIIGSLSVALLFGTTSAYAVNLADTDGIDGQASVEKVVSLGVFPVYGANFNPDSPLNRADFASIVNRLVWLPSGKAVAFTDVKATNANYANAVKLVNNGYLAPVNNAFKLTKGVTYGEFAKALAYGLGVKKSWTTRPIDFLYYLDRRGVLDITTDLDAVITRGEAAVAIDKYITLSGKFETAKGITTKVDSTHIVINDGGSDASYTFAKGAVVFVSDNEAKISDLSVGSPVTIVLNKKGQVAFASSVLLDNESGTITLDGGQWKIKDSIIKGLNLDAYIANLPGDSESFSLTQLNQFLGEDVTLSGTVFFATDSDEVTAVYPYISKAADKAFKVVGSKIAVSISDDVTKTLPLNEAVKITLDDKDAQLTDLKADGKYTATIEANANGEITVLAVKTVVEEPAATK